jgi:YbgC/YbaW family acyl-CoA thioester hydrolase
MARIKLDLPDNFIFSTVVHVRVSDVNYGGHLGNDSILSLIHEARVRFLNKYGYSEFNVEGRGIIMTDAVIVYKSQGFYGDELMIEVTVRDLTRLGCDFFYRLTNTKTGKEVARAKTAVVFFDYKNHRTVEMPIKFKELFVTA